MKYYIKKSEVTPEHGEEEHGSWKMLESENGCTNGVHTAISYYKLEQFRTPEVHDEQEGFCVISGHGWAKVGEEEFELEPETSFVAPAGVYHSVKCKDKNDPLIVFWFRTKP